VKRCRIALLATLLLGCAGAEPPPPAAAEQAQRALREQAEPALRVGTSGDYVPFSLRAAGGLAGFDVEVARAYARERGLRIRWVRLRWAELDRDFAAGAFDVVMSGVTVRPERSLAGRFSVPVTTSGLVLLAREGRALRLDGGARLVVNAGGHLERAARRLFPAAKLRPLSPNAAVREALLAGEADAAVTDTLEAPGWLAGTSGIETLGPYTRDWKAYWLPASAGERARDLDAWLLAREADGTLTALRARTLPESAREATAAPLVALGAAIEERFALMPLVAEAKRASGAPVRAPEQERAVLDAALRSVREAAAQAGTTPPSEAAVAAFFTALIDGARESQEHALAGPPDPAPPVDLERILRPALARISERIAWLLVRLPPALDQGEVNAALTPLGAQGVSPQTRDRIAAALRAPR
jgi:cyclohexadienyl dehydratase